MRNKRDFIQKRMVCIMFIFVLRNPDEVYKVGEEVRSMIGDVDILINNAGVVIGKGILDCPDDMIEKTFNVNLLAHFWVSVLLID